MAKKSQLTARQLADWKQRSEAAALATGKNSQLKRVSKSYLAVKGNTTEERKAKPHFEAEAKLQSRKPEKN